MIFELTILGNNSAVPAYGRHPTAQVLKHHNQQFLIDCGEGTQFRMLKYRIKRANLNHIFISHLHGDHFFGLIGLIHTLNLSGRKADLHIFGPKGLKEIIDVHQKDYEDRMNYKVIITELNYGQKELIYESNLIEVYTLPLLHRIECNGFLFKEKPHQRKMRTEYIDKYNIPYQAIQGIKDGNDFTCENGEVIKNKDLTFPAPPSRAYAFCSDTAYNEALIPLIKGANLLYHEATFMKNAEERAKETHHSTTEQAGIIAKKAKVNKLIIGHFSARYKDLTPLLSETQKQFTNSALAHEGKVFEIE